MRDRFSATWLRAGKESETTYRARKRPTLQVFSYIVLKLKTSFLGCLGIEKDRQATASLTDYFQNQTTQSASMGSECDGIFPQVLLLEAFATGEANSEHRINIAYRAFKFEDQRLLLWIR